jgi:hypothetical protein
MDNEKSNPLRDHRVWAREINNLNDAGLMQVVRNMAAVDRAVHKATAAATAPWLTQLREAA